MSKDAPAALQTAATDDSIDLNERDVRALSQYLTVLDDYGRARDADGLYMVVSESGEEYLVDTRTDTCECPDHEYRGVRCKHLRRVAFATGAREIPAGVACDVDDQLGMHVHTGAPRQAATDGGQTLSPDVAEQLTDEEIAAREADDVDVDIDETDGRPDACDCEPWMGSEGLPCFECWRRDFSTPNPDVLDEDDSEDGRDRPERSEPADFGGGESTGVVDLLGGADDR
jgi:hypothetical protein